MTEPETKQNSDDPICIMLIDDEASVLHALTLLLKAIGYNAIGFTAPQEALEALKEKGAETCDLIICDLRMPDLNGIDVLKSKVELCPQIPFVLMSAHASNEDIAEAKELGAAAFLAKPFSPDQIHEVVKELCSD